MTMNIENFYNTRSRSSSSVATRLAEREIFFKNHPAPEPFKLRLDGPSDIWRIFPMLSDAIQFAKTCPECNVFAYELETFERNCGKRTYLVTTTEEFWHYYRQLTPAQRHHYEVIQPDQPCHLYFDIEYPIPNNPGKDGERAVQILIQLVCGFLNQSFHVTCSPQQVLQLDASIPEKFSQHLIFHIEGAAFYNNLHMGRFIEHVCDEIGFILGQTCLASTTVSTKNTETHTTCTTDPNESTADGLDHTNTDQGQENNNENCSIDSGIAEHGRTDNINIDFTAHEQQCAEQIQKEDVTGLMGEDGIQGVDEDIVRVVSEDAMEDESWENCSFSELLSDSANISADCTLDIYGRFIRLTNVLTNSGLTVEDLQTLAVWDRNNRRTLLLDKGVYNKNRNFRLFLSSKRHKNNPLVASTQNIYKSSVEVDEKSVFHASLITNIEGEGIKQYLKWPDNGLHRPRASITEEKNVEGRQLDGCQSSPYPEIDQFIESIINKGGVQGAVRKWTYFSESETLLYEICKNHWCENIGRAHRSNNIMFIVDLKKGVYYQKCHDQECKAFNFKSQERPVPPVLLPSYYLQFLDEDMMNENSDSPYELDDQELLELSACAEQTLFSVQENQ